MLNESITVDNYFMQSVGTFTTIPAELTQKIISYAKDGKDFSIDGCTFKFNFKSYSSRYNSHSYYYTVNDEIIYRVSDHWSHIIGEHEHVAIGGVRVCGSIKACFWSLILATENDIIKTNDGVFIGGCCAFDKLKANDLVN